VLLLEKNIFGFYVNSDSTVDADCYIHINSQDKEALYVNSGSSVISTGTCLVGEAYLNSGGTATPDPVEGCAEMADPLVSLPEPANAAAACDHIDYTVNNGEHRTMTPGVYCKKTLVNSGGTAVMQPGVYVFREGPFEINSLSSVSGGGVMLFFADKDAYLKVNSDSTLQLSAPTSGTYAGMLMFQSRHPSTISAPGSEVNSDSASKLEGTIYLPNGVLVINSLSDLNQSASYTAVVAKRMVVNSFGNFYLRSDFDGPTPLPPLLQSFRASTAARLTN
jgi:hypothetical protein